MSCAAVSVRRVAAVAVVVAALAMGGCAPSPSASPSAAGPSAAPSAAVSAPPSGGSLVIVGRILTMDQPPIAEALLIQDGLLAAVGTRDEVLALADDDTPVMDIGQNVAYPGFIDTHAHWIGDRNYYGPATPADAMDAALSRGWTSISEQWNNEEKVNELEVLAAENALPMRVDAYLALGEAFSDTHYGDWYADREPGPIGDHLRVRGLKIHLDNGMDGGLFWTVDELTGTILRANEAGWQVSVHTISTEAHDMVLDAFEWAIGPNGPNPLHHRIDHAIEVSDEQLARMVAMDLATVIHLDGVAVDWVLWSEYFGEGDDFPEEKRGWLTRWRDFVEAGLHVASATDAPWFFPDFVLTDDMGRVVDQIAGGMDGRGREFPEVTDWMLEQLLTAEQGLRTITVDAAWALGDEARRGRLAPGMLGDVTILSGDLTAPGATPDDIRALSVVATIVDGTVAYCGAPEVCSPAETSP